MNVNSLFDHSSANTLTRVVAFIAVCDLPLAACDLIPAVCDLQLAVCD